MSRPKPSPAQKRQRMRLRLLDANRVLMYHRGRGTHQEAMADKIARDTAAWLERNP